MKKILTGIACFFAFAFSLQAQTLYGTTSAGGNDGGGTINKFQPATNNLIVAKSFESFAQYPTGSLIQAKNGKLYGMTAYGGSNGVGVILSFDPSSSTYTKVKDFDKINGATPWGSLLQARDGKLYGMTKYGGSNNDGVIFSFDPASSTYRKLKDFDLNNGGLPDGDLIQATDGKLYGMTEMGGTGGVGVIFSFDPASKTYTKLKDFDGINGGNPFGSFMQASDGSFYGMTKYGGSNNAGVIFSFEASSSTYTKLKDFDYTNGGYPKGSLMQASNGKLYGMTQMGGAGFGVIFSFDPASKTYTKLKDFDGTNGGGPPGSLIQASDGKLYGMAGVIFSFDPSSSIYTKLKDFEINAGGGTFGSLMQARDGKLYGMTYYGSSGGNAIFSFDPSSSTYTMLTALGATQNGSLVSGSLTQATDGKIYGMTTYGGSNGVGVIFSFDPLSSTYTKLKDFDYNNGTHPRGSLMQANDGKLYGMTAFGGNNDVGVIFSFDLSSSTYTKLKDFDYSIGSHPSGSVMQASDGKLYGMAGGGNNGYGVIFSFEPSSSTYIRLVDFDSYNGAYPSGSLIQAKDGKLYGMTDNGGNNDVGVIFSFDPLSSTYTKLKDFDYNNGTIPRGSLVQATDGKLYGMTETGGSNNAGVIFSFDPSSSTYTKLKDFDFTNGAYPNGSLMQASDGKLYGMARGGTYNNGVIFSLDPSSSTYTKLQDYTGANGASPGLGCAFIEESTQPLLTISDATVYEAAQSATLTVTLSKKTDQDVSADFKTVNGTAKIPFDYTKEKGTVTIPAGSQSASISVPIVSDDMVEPTEQFYVELEKPVNASIGKSTGTVTVLDEASLNSTIAKTGNEQQQIATGFILKASPNPSSSQFKLEIESNNSNELLSLHVVDVLGKIVEEKNNIFPGQTLQIGNNYKPGVYFVILTQGNNKKQVKLIKL